MTLKILLALMCLAAIVFIGLPLYRDRKRLTPNTTLLLAVIALLSAGLYAYQGRPDVPSGRGGQEERSLDELVAALEQRLQSEPGDVDGWKMLGRTQMTMRQYDDAVRAFERVLELEGANNAQTLVSLGEALLARDGGGITGRPAALFESALAIDPNIPQALFYGGIGAANSGDTELAATRWEKLQGLNPPAEIREILSQKIAEWRGLPIPPALSQAQPVEQPGTIVSAQIGLSNLAAGAITRDATVFVIARDPVQPSPPIAVVRRRVSELPTRVDLGDQHSMVPGRSLSGFPEIELLVRVSMSGQPAAQPGDWYTSSIVRPAEQSALELTIDQQVQ